MQVPSAPMGKGDSTRENGHRHRRGVSPTEDRPPFSAEPVPIFSDPFKDLTWDEIQEWAGTAVVSRWQRYQRSRLVPILSCRVPFPGFWQHYLAALRRANERKRLLVRMLDTLAGRRIIEGVQ